METRAGAYQRNLHTKAGEVTLKMPEAPEPPSETQIIERYSGASRRSKKTLIEMYLAGISVRRVEDITEAL